MVFGQGTVATHRGGLGKEQLANHYTQCITKVTNKTHENGVRTRVICNKNGMDARLTQGYSYGVSAVHTLRSRMTHWVCRVQGMQSFHQGVERRLCITMASHAGTEDAQSSEKPVWQNKISSFSESSVAAVRTFPWEKVYGRFGHRALDLVWITAKWLAIPVLALSTISELLYTLSAGKDIFIPLGILTGVLLAKIVGNASLDVVKELQDARTSWPLIGLGMLFVLLKLPGPYYPSWAAAFLPHVANAGLVQTAFLFRESHRMVGSHLN